MTTFQSPRAQRDAYNNPWTEPVHPDLTGPKPDPRGVDPCACNPIDGPCSIAHGLRDDLGQPLAAFQSPEAQAQAQVARMETLGILTAEAGPSLAALVRKALSARRIQCLPTAHVKAPSSLAELEAEHPTFPAGYGQSDPDAAWRRSRKPEETYSFLRVSDAYSDRTIWASPQENYAFRAWHDAVHLEIGADFDQAGELAVACAQVEEARQRGASYRDLACLWAETYGQDRLMRERGAFPVDQAAYVALVLAVGVERAVKEWRAGR